MAANPKSRRDLRSEIRNPKLKGFTLIELLVAIFIIGILVTLVIGVSNYVFEEASRKETQATQTIVMQAIEAYRDVMGNYPPDNNTTDPNYTSYSYTDATCLMPHLTALNCYTGTKQTKIRKATGPIMLKLSAEAMKTTDPDKLFDGFGKAMRYEQDGGLGGRPVLISDGDDGDPTTADDIRSDGS